MGGAVGVFKDQFTEKKLQTLLFWSKDYFPFLPNN